MMKEKNPVDKKQYPTLLIAVLSALLVSIIVFVFAAPPIMHATIERSVIRNEIETAVIQSFRLMRYFPWTSEARSAAYRLLSMREQSSSTVLV